jgi:hypothetical protein
MGRIVDLNDGKSWESLQFLENQRKEQRLAAATREHEIFFKNLTISMDNFKASLAKEKEPGFDDYPGWLQPYRPWLWCELPFPPKDWKSIEVLAKVAVNIALAPEPIRNHITYKVSFGAWYIPKVKYEVVAPPSPRSKGRPAKPGTVVPCLRWQMATYILSTTEFWLEEGTIPDKQDEWTWDIKCTPECLGKAYNGPVFWQYQDAFTTPLSLLALLAAVVYLSRK